MSKYINYFTDYFWYIFGVTSFLILVVNYFHPSLSELDKVYHSLVIIISILAIDIQKWLAK